ncbi:MAG: PilN domain-containing protein [Nitrospiraceae bacterium]|nr:PilN domain-containing protein [Nitrospiraceae bacterium]
MIKVNLLPVKKKKKSRQFPGFIVAMFFITIAAIAAGVFLSYRYSEKVLAKKSLVAANDAKIAELDRKIKSVADYEKRNQDYKARKDIIEKLGKNRTLPVKVLDEISARLPSGVWFNSVDLQNSGSDITLQCVAFTNTDVVNYVNNLKGSTLFSDVFLNESVQSQISGFNVYTFSLIIKVKA